MASFDVLKEDHYYSTRELSKLLRANESTVKRWADSGKLKCFKTPGGHRKFPPWHVAEFITKYRYELITQMPYQGKQSRYPGSGPGGHRVIGL